MNRAKGNLHLKLGQNGIFTREVSIQSYFGEQEIWWQDLWKVQVTKLPTEDVTLKLRQLVWEGYLDGLP